MSSGYLYVAMGRQYIEEAERAACVLKKHSHGKICLITDGDYRSNVFDEIKIVTFPQHQDIRHQGFASKIFGIMYSPFDKTIFLDTDTYILSDVTELFDILDFYDLLIAHDYMEDSYALYKGMDFLGYRTYNSGVMAFRKSDQIKNLFDLWRKLYDERSIEYRGDQPALMEALMYSYIKTYHLQTNYNFRFNQFMTIPNGKVKILHGRHPNPEGIGRLINATEEHRSWDPKAWRCHGWNQEEISFRSMKRILKRIFRYYL